MKKLVLADSAIRESIRRSSVQTRGLLREVVSSGGVTLPNGTHVPKGTWLGVPVQPVHMDGDLYDKPYEYNPFRFAKMRSEDIVPSHEKLDATDISDTFLGWGYGRYAWLVHLFQALTVNVGHCHLPPKAAKKQIKLC